MAKVKTLIMKNIDAESINKIEPHCDWDGKKNTSKLTSHNELYYRQKLSVEIFIIHFNKMRYKLSQRCLSKDCPAYMMSAVVL